MNATKPAQSDPSLSAKEAERALRVDLAAALRLGYHDGWNRTINNHITARLPDRGDQFLMNPKGPGWDEITASKLVRLSLEGEVLDPPDGLVAPAGLNFHSGILRAHNDVNCIIHVHAMAGVLVSALREELMIVDQASCHIEGEVAYHEFEGFAEGADEVPRLLEDMGDKPALIMRNHGVLTVGRSIGEAFQRMSRLIRACEIHIALRSTGVAINPIPEPALAATRQQIAEKRRRPGYSENEWKYHRRRAMRIAPDLDQ